MLDIKFIREHKELVQKTAEQKNIRVDITKVLELDDARKLHQAQFDQLRSEQKKASDGIATAKGEEKKELIASIKTKTEALDSIKAQLADTEASLQDLLYLVPQIPAEGWLVGKSEADNKVLETWGEPTKFAFTPKSHIELGMQNDWIDFERGTKFMGYRGYFLKGFAAQLEQAVLRYGVDFMRERGFTFMTTPTLGRGQFFYGTGHFPFAQKETFQVVTDEREGDLYLTGTAEVALMGYHADEILEEKDLPKKYTGLSACYRTEVGGYGKDTKGLYRVRHFNKVEQVVLCKADATEAHDYFLKMAEFAKEFLRSLELPHRVLQLCTADMGAGKVEMYDIETWMPSRKAYGETHSCSRLDDWQTRRLKIRYRTSGGEIKFAFSLNNTVVATPRILIPLLEIYQNPDGTVRVPKSLEKYM